MHNRQAQAAPAPFCREIRDKQPLFHLIGNARPSVRDKQHDHAASRVIRRLQVNFPLLIHGLNRVVKQIHDNLLQLPGVRRNHADIFRKAGAKLHMFMKHRIRRHRVAQQIMQMNRLFHDGGHPRKFGEFIHQMAQSVHFVNDHFRGFFKNFLVTRRFFLRLPPQTFCRKLNRRQRIFYFMREPPRHFAPRGDALRLQQLRQIIEHDQHAEIGVPLVIHAVQVRKQRQRFAVDLQLELLLVSFDFLLVDAPQNRNHALHVRLIEKSAVMLAQNLVARNLQNARRRPIESRHDAVGVNRNDAGIDIFQHGFDVAPPLGQRVGHGLQIRGHAVE